MVMLSVCCMAWSHTTAACMLLRSPRLRESGPDKVWMQGTSWKKSECSVLCRYEDRMFLPQGWGNSPRGAKVTGSLPAAAFWTQIVRDHECTVKDLTALSHGKTANNPTSQGNPEEVVAWRKALRDLFSSCSWGEDVPVTTFPFRVQLTLLSNPCLFLTQIAPRLPGKQRKFQRHPQHSPVGTETHPCQGGKGGKQHGLQGGFAASSWRCY